MASFKDCIEFAMQNNPLFSYSKIVFKEKQLQTMKVYTRQSLNLLNADHGRSHFFFFLIKP